MTTFGIPFVYYGEEIGMHQSYVSIKDSLDELGKRWEGFPEFMTRFFERISGEHLSRDGARTPMQWNSREDAGFTSTQSDSSDDKEVVKPWLPVDHHSKEISVMSELEDPDSLLHCYKRFIKLRNESKVLQSGGLRFLKVSSLEGPKNNKKLEDQVLAYSRYDSGTSEDNKDSELFVFLNFSEKEVILRNSFSASSLVASTVSNKSKRDKSAVFVNEELEGEGIKLASYEGLVIN
jgi:glycosidase